MGAAESGNQRWYRRRPDPPQRCSQVATVLPSSASPSAAINAGTAAGPICPSAVASRDGLPHIGIAERGDERWYCLDRRRPDLPQGHSRRGADQLIGIAERGDQLWHRHRPDLC